MKSVVSTTFLNFIYMKINIRNMIKVKKVRTKWTNRNKLDLRDNGPQKLEADDLNELI